jgi:hypothetical protein
MVTGDIYDAGYERSIINICNVQHTPQQHTTQHSHTLTCCRTLTLSFSFSLTELRDPGGGVGPKPDPPMGMTRIPPPN